MLIMKIYFRGMAQWKPKLVLSILKVLSKQWVKSIVMLFPKVFSWNWPLSLMLSDNFLISNKKVWILVKILSVLLKSSVKNLF